MHTVFILLSIPHESLHIIDLSELMPEPIAITLGALTLLDPAFQACRKVYGVYKLIDTLDNIMFNEESEGNKHESSSFLKHVSPAYRILSFVRP